MHKTTDALFSLLKNSLQALMNFFFWVALPACAPWSSDVLMQWDVLSLSAGQVLAEGPVTHPCCCEAPLTFLSLRSMT